MLLKILRILFVCILIVGCHKTARDDFLLALEQIEVNGRKYILEAALWCSFMPVCPPDGNPLFGRAWLTAIDTQPIPLSISMNRLWVIKNYDVWETEFAEINRTPITGRTDQLEGLFVDGPKWGPDIYVDVVVRVIDITRDQECLLRKSHVMIGRLSK